MFSVVASLLLKESLVAYWIVVDDGRVSEDQVSLSLDSVAAGVLAVNKAIWNEKQCFLLYYEQHL
jgi:hypothetical protein